MIEQIELKQLLKTDISNITHLQPDGWKDIRKVFLRFIDYDFFFPVKAIFKNQIIGIGEVIYNQDTAWIGNIVVDKTFRKKGIGAFITNYLSKQIRLKNKSTQLILATPQGKPLYEKLGFKYLSNYLFFKREEEKKEKEKWRTEKRGLEKENIESTNSFNLLTSSPLDSQRNIQHYDPKYFRQLAEMDKIAMGENRSEVLKEFTHDALLFVKDDLEGFYLPHLGDGLIIAKNHEAGFSLLEIKWSTKSESIILPDENVEIIEFAKSKGFKPYRYAARMILGKEFSWNPQMIYNRVGGYLG